MRIALTADCLLACRGATVTAGENPPGMLPATKNPSRRLEPNRTNVGPHGQGAYFDCKTPIEEVR